MLTAALLPLLLTLASATPLLKRQDSPAPDSEDGDFRNNYHGSQLCEVQASNGTDDSSAVADAVNRCKSDATILFTPGAEYVFAQPVRFQDLSNVEVRAWGNIHLPAMQEVQQALQSQNGSDVPWIFVSGDRVVWRGSEKHDSGWIYGNGTEWSSSSSGGGGNATTGGHGGATGNASASASQPSQPSQSAAGNATASANSTSGGNQTAPSSGGNSTSGGSSGSQQASPPNLFAWHLSNSEVHNLKVAHPPALAAYVAAYNATFSNFTIDASVNGSSANSAGGFHLEGEDVNVQNGAIFVGGPSVAVRNNASNIAVDGLLLAGGQVALAIDGAEGSNVQNVSFSDITVVDAQQGSHMSGPAGSIEEVSFTNIDVHNVSLPISVDNGGNSTLDLDTIVWEDWRGNMGTNGTTVAEFNCGEGRCRDFKVEAINILTSAGESPEVKCQGIDNQTSPDFGFQCTNGPLTEIPPGGAVSGGGSGGGNATQPSGGAGGNATQPYGGTGGNATQPSGGAGGNATQPSGGAGGNATQPSGGAGGNSTQPGGGVVGGGAGGASSPAPPLATASGASSSGAPIPSGSASSVQPSGTQAPSGSAAPSGSQSVSESAQPSASSAAPSGSQPASSESAQPSGSSAAPSSEAQSSSAAPSSESSAAPSASESSAAPSGSEAPASSSSAPAPSDSAASSAPAPSSEAPQSSPAPAPSSAPPPSESAPAPSQSQ